MENYKQIKSDLDELRLLVEKSELWVYKSKKDLPTETRVRKITPGLVGLRKDGGSSSSKEPEQRKDSLEQQDLEVIGTNTSQVKTSAYSSHTLMYLLYWERTNWFRIWFFWFVEFTLFSLFHFPRTRTVVTVRVEVLRCVNWVWQNLVTKNINLEKLKNKQYHRKVLFNRLFNVQSSILPWLKNQLA